MTKAQADHDAAADKARTEVRNAAEVRKQIEAAQKALLAGQRALDQKLAAAEQKLAELEDRTRTIAEKRQQTEVELARRSDELRRREAAVDLLMSKARPLAEAVSTVLKST